MYFSELIFAVEIDEKGHTDRNQNDKNEKETKIEKYSDCKFFHRINLDTEGFDIFLEISKIKDYIIQSNEKKKRTRKQNKRTRRENKRSRKQNKRT